MNRIEAIYLAAAFVVTRHCKRRGVKPTMEMVENLVKQIEDYDPATTATQTPAP